MIIAIIIAVITIDGIISGFVVFVLMLIIGASFNRFICGWFVGGVAAVLGGLFDCRVKLRQNASLQVLLGQFLYKMGCLMSVV